MKHSWYFTTSKSFEILVKKHKNGDFYVFRWHHTGGIMSIDFSLAVGTHCLRIRFALLHTILVVTSQLCLATGIKKRALQGLLLLTLLSKVRAFGGHFLLLLADQPRTWRSHRTSPWQASWQSFLKSRAIGRMRSAAMHCLFLFLIFGNNAGRNSI